MMKINITIQDRQRTVEWTYAGDRLQWKVDGVHVDADAIKVAPGIFSIIVDGESFEAQVEGDSSRLRVLIGGREYLSSIENPRELKKRGAGAAQIEGRQNVVAPMAGKIIQSLVKAGDEVQSGQGLLIVEAMKMQNEIRSPKSGKIEVITVIEGQTVNPGDTVAIVA
jgi:biotin carboxyl carrier protein